MRPDTFVVGAPKAGTTSLHEYLRGHPDITMSTYKEPGYFAPDVTGTRPRQRYVYGRDEAAYLDLFNGARNGQRVGESSTNYLMSHEAPRLIHEFAPGARIVIMVRNPVDLVYSLHGERLANGPETIPDFDEAIAADDDRRAGKRLPNGLSGYGVAYRDNALLGEQVERWFGEFGTDEVHVMVHNDFVADTPAAFSRLLQFLGVDASYRPDSFDVLNPSHAARRGPVAAVMRGSAARWVARSAMPALLGEERTRSVGRRFGRRRFTDEEVTRQPMSPQTRAQLTEEFRPDVERLGRALDRDLASEWLVPATKVADA